MPDSPREPANAPADGVGDLFDYDVPLDDILQDAPAQAPTTQQKPPADGTGLGVDEEVKVTKARAPVAKLDENRLLSQNGIPKLRRVAKTKLKFKGKGHEFSDAARLLNFYQLWLDDLFPKAKFADGLTMIEKLGHSRRIQGLRREWIEEEKPGRRVEDEPEREAELEPEVGTGARTESAPRDGQGVEQPREDTGIDGETAQQPDENAPSTSVVPDRSIPRQPPDEDAGQGLFFSDDEDNLQDNRQDVPGEDVPEHDELDDLLREQEEEALNIT